MNEVRRTGAGEASRSGQISTRALPGHRSPLSAQTIGIKKEDRGPGQPNQATSHQCLKLCARRRTSCSNHLRQVAERNRDVDPYPGILPDPIFLPEIKKHAHQALASTSFGPGYRFVSPTTSYATAMSSLRASSLPTETTLRPGVISHSAQRGISLLGSARKSAGGSSRQR